MCRKLIRIILRVIDQSAHDGSPDSKQASLGASQSEPIGLCCRPHQCPTSPRTLKTRCLSGRMTWSSSELMARIGWNMFHPIFPRWICPTILNVPKSRRYYRRGRGWFHRRDPTLRGAWDYGAWLASHVNYSEWKANMRKLWAVRWAELANVDPFE